MPSLPTFSDYLVFVDESGDHGLTRIDKQFPVFVLLFVIVKKDDYVGCVCPELQRFKLTFWGHSEVVLHERDIRKSSGSFGFLQQEPIRDKFMEQLTAQMKSLPATVIAVVIDKLAHKKRYKFPANPYDYALEAGLERVFGFLKIHNQSASTTAIIVEQRGRREDNEMELAFSRICSGSNALQKRFPFQRIMIPKSSNSAGLQIADLMARPVALHHLRPDQTNRAYEIVKAKLHRSSTGKIEGWGLKSLP